ncbi:MAG: polysaccharide deacetylase family protein [Victivallaceae bacterium]|nr:polysaccharide deacetylase family protein [Victivallaceae bacterium]
MKKTLLSILSVVSLMPYLMAEEISHAGAVGFRFDDNMKPQTWSAIHDTFRKYDMPFTLAIVSGNLARDTARVNVLRKIVADGGELADHTASHSSMQIVFGSEAEAQKVKDHPGVAELVGRKVCLRFQFNSKYRYNRPLTVTVRNNQLVDVDDAVVKNLKNQDFLVFPDGKVYGVKVQKKIYELCSPYGSPMTVPDMEKQAAIRTDRFGLQPTEDAMRLLAQQSRENFQKAGLPPPRTLIIPGGWGIFPIAENIAKIYGKEFSYVSADAHNRWAGTYARPDLVRERYSMSPEWNSLERLDVKASKKLIADLIALHRVTIFVSHFWSNNVPGKEAGLLARNDELLAWLKAKSIPVKTMAQCTEDLLKNPASPSFNLMPSLKQDLNEDNIPDGYMLGKGVSVKEDALVAAQGGMIFTIRKLSGLTAGKNTFRCQVEAPAGTQLTFDIGLYGDNSPNVVRKLSPKKMTLPSANAPLHFSFDVPKWCPGLDISCTAAGNAPISVRNLSLRVE